MQRINTASKAEDLFGPGRHGFKNGDLGLGVAPTDLNAEWFNQVQEELLSVIEASGLVPAASSTQVRQAIKRMFAGNVKLLTNAGSPHTLTVDDAGMVLINATAGNVVVNLPAANVLAGLIFRFRRTDTATGNSVTVNRAGADTIDEGGTSFTIASKAMQSIESDGATTWSTISSSVFATAAEAQAFTNTIKALSPATLAAAFKGGNQSIAAAGFQKWPGDLIFQFGYSTTGPGVKVLFPIAFPTAMLGLTFGDVVAASNAEAQVGTTAYDRFGYFVASPSGVGSDAHFFMAIGH